MHRGTLTTIPGPALSGVMFHLFPLIHLKEWGGTTRAFPLEPQLSSALGTFRTWDADGGVDRVHDLTPKDSVVGGDTGLNSVRQNEMFASNFNDKTLVQSSREKYSCFVFPNFVIDCRHPTSTRGALRAIVTTREVGRRWPRNAAA
jgi:hypothetical protein